MCQNERVADKLPGCLARENEGKRAPDPFPVERVPAALRAGVYRRTIQGDCADRVSRPEDLLQIRTQVLTVEKNCVILGEHVGVGLGLPQQELDECEIIVWPSTDPGLPKREREVRVAACDRRSRVDEEPGPLPAGTDQAIEAEVNCGFSPRRSDDAYRPCLNA